jgi:hypothetical protein
LGEVFLEQLIGELSLIPGLVLAALLMDRFGRARLISNYMTSKSNISNSSRRARRESQQRPTPPVLLHGQHGLLKSNKKKKKTHPILV